MPRLFSPGVLGGGPGAVTLNGDVVGATANTEETIFAPVCAPRVTHQPVRRTVLFAISDHRDVVHDFKVTRVVAVDASGVFLERIGNSNAASDGSSLCNLLLHVLFSADVTKLLNAVGEVAIGHAASFAGGAISAHVHG